MFVPRMSVDQISGESADGDLPAGVRIRRFKSVRMLALVIVAGMLAFGLWRSGLFEKWGARGEQKAAQPTVTLVGQATVVDTTLVDGARWMLLAQPTTDGTLCYQLADTNGNVGFPCTAGITPMKLDSKDAASVIFPALSTEATMPPVVMGAVANNVSRLELTAGSAVQRIVPVPAPEVGRSGFIAPIQTDLVEHFLDGALLVVARDANGRCMAALRAIPSGEMVLSSTRDCPK